jgi:hypothetical protein
MKHFDCFSMRLLRFARNDNRYVALTIECTDDTECREIRRNKTIIVAAYEMDVLVTRTNLGIVVEASRPVTKRVQNSS